MGGDHKDTILPYYHLHRHAHLKEKFVSLFVYSKSLLLAYRRPRKKSKFFLCCTYIIGCVIAYMVLLSIINQNRYFFRSKSQLALQEETTFKEESNIIPFKPANITGIDFIFVISPPMNNTLFDTPEEIDATSPPSNVTPSERRLFYLFRNERLASLTFNYIPRIELDSPEVQEFIAMTPGSSLRGGQLACWLSHVKVWKLMIQYQIQSAIIFEDDIEVDLHIKTKIHDLYQEEKKHAAVEIKSDSTSTNQTNVQSVWPDIMLLGHCYTWPDTSAETMAGNVEWFSCTHGYIFTLQGAYKFLRYLEHDPFHNEQGVDIAMILLGKDRGYSMRALKVPLVRQLPRGLFQGENVSGPDELPMQELDAPALFSNADFRDMLEHRSSY